jgi:hypothetical protein
MVVVEGSTESAEAFMASLSDGRGRNGLWNVC